jgi:hypothetical protein
MNMPPQTRRGALPAGNFPVPAAGIRAMREAKTMAPENIKIVPIAPKTSQAARE